MSQQTVSKCYKEIILDPSLLCLIPREEWTSVRALPLKVTLLFRTVLERLFIHLASPAMWGKAGVEFITNNGQKVIGEAIPVAVLVRDGVGEGNLCIVTNFCHHNQAKVEASEVFSALHQHDSQEPSVVVMRRFTNSCYPPWGSFPLFMHDHFLWGCFIHPMPTGLATLTQAILFL